MYRSNKNLRQGKILAFCVAKFSEMIYLFIDWILVF